MTTVSISLILGGWVTTIGGGMDRVGDNNVLSFLCYWLDKKMPL